MIIRCFRSFFLHGSSHCPRAKTLFFIGRQIPMKLKKLSLGLATGKHINYLIASRIQTKFSKEKNMLHTSFWRCSASMHQQHIFMHCIEPDRINRKVKCSSFKEGLIIRICGFRQFSFSLKQFQFQTNYMASVSLCGQIWGNFFPSPIFFLIWPVHTSGSICLYIYAINTIETSIKRQSHG